MGDAIWRCNGGAYRVHKLVLVTGSSYFKEILATADNEDVLTVISTPDLNARVVRCVLCLFYTGEVNIDWDILKEVNLAFKLLGFNGENVDVTTTGEARTPKHAVTELPTRDTSPPAKKLRPEEIFCFRKPKLKPSRQKKKKYSSDDDFMVGDAAFGLSDSDNDDEWAPPRDHKKKTKKKVKAVDNDDDYEKSPIVLKL